MVTFWRYVGPGARPGDGDRLLGDTVRHFHSALADIAGELPRLTEKIDHASELLQDASATPGLTAADRAVAARARDRLAPLVRSLGQATALHAERRRVVPGPVPTRRRRSPTRQRCTGKHSAGAGSVADLAGRWAGSAS